MIDLKRFHANEHGVAKIKIPISFPISGLNLSDFSTEIGFDKDVPIYDLYATINHDGGFYSGHYTANVLYNASWIQKNDASSQETENINENSAYMLFYRQRRPGDVVPAVSEDETVESNQEAVAEEWKFHERFQVLEKWPKAPAKTKAKENWLQELLHFLSGTNRF